MSVKYCPVCISKMRTGLAIWHFECPVCLYEGSELKPGINKKIAHQQIDEQWRGSGLRSLRIENFNTLLKAIRASGKSSGKLLDVGCAHGWFLEAAEKSGFQVQGIEPDLSIFNATCQRGLPVRCGFFPETLSASERYDVIVFNDVFEHVPDLSAILAGCNDHLKSDGVLVLNLPSSSGIFYNLSRFLSRIGVHSFFNRLWQKDLPSPHLHYFNLNNLHWLLQKNGFEPVDYGRLSTLRFKGLFARISYTGKKSLPVRLLIYLVVVSLLPVLLKMPSDIVYSISKKNS